MFDKNTNPNPDYRPPLPIFSEPPHRGTCVQPASSPYITITKTEYIILLEAQRDLDLLKKNYRESSYGSLDSAVEKTILGPKPKPPAPDPIEQAVNAAVSAAESAKKAAEMVVKMATAETGEGDHA